MISREEYIEQSAFMAAMLEASAPKPGNVSPLYSKGKTKFEHFIASASAIAPVMGKIAAGEFSLGQGIFHAVNRSMSIQRGGNVHLGIILLFAPISSAAGVSDSLGLGSLRMEIKRILDSTDYQDTVYVYNAIKHSEASGVPKEVMQEKTLKEIIEGHIPLKEWMSRGKKNNLIAREYSEDFRISFETALPAIKSAYQKENDILRAILIAYLNILSRYEDSLIYGKFGKESAEDVKKKAKEVLKTMDDEVIQDFHRYLIEKGMNPGTSADIVASALYLGILSREIEL